MASPDKRAKLDEKSTPVRLPLKLRYVGFCGVDESFEDESKYTWPEYIEWGVLFREEKEGLLRFPKRQWVEEFVKGKKHLAAHLCSSRCDAVLSGEFDFVRDLHCNLGFGRFQINATQGNGVDSKKLGDIQVQNILKLACEFPNAEFIVQRNEETRVLWEGIENSGDRVPRNISYLFDASVGRGLVVDEFPKPQFEWAKYGYAGGIKPENVESVIKRVAENVPSGVPTWIDMESGIRIKESDEFSSERAWKVCQIVNSLQSGGEIIFG